MRDAAETQHKKSGWEGEPNYAWKRHFALSYDGNRKLPKPWFSNLWSFVLSNYAQLDGLMSNGHYNVFNMATSPHVIATSVVLSMTKKAKFAQKKRRLDGVSLVSRSQMP